MSTSINSIEFNLLNNSSLGERIRFLRTKLMDEVDPVQYTTNAISKRTGIAAQTLTSIERGESKKPSFSVIHALAKDFNVQMDVFTDDYYEGSEKLFSLGESSITEIDLGDFEIDEADSLIVDGKEYLVGESTVLSRRRNISVYVVEKFEDDNSTLLYHHHKSLKEDELIQVLSVMIQTLELSPFNLSYNEWLQALKKSPLQEANNIVSEINIKHPNITISLEE
ncbi:helix-turn-helix domain-containing protein [Rummeliibacillus sp. NPDC094406]|uniref:helix-turn-helix domain-containing protein n=1 Tax=Rummeliibacillus sp. NPDC094406 TaxID=3364511 RepID=UPI0037F38F8E